MALKPLEFTNCLGIYVTKKTGERGDTCHTSRVFAGGRDEWFVFADEPMQNFGLRDAVRVLYQKIKWARADYKRERGMIT